MDTARGLFYKLVFKTGCKTISQRSKLFSSLQIISFTSTQTVVVFMASTELGAAHRILRIFFIPFLAPGHMIPMLDIAKLFARHRRSVAATVITTPGNEPLVRPAIDAANANADILPIDLVLIPFPSSVAPLLNGRENIAAFPSNNYSDFFAAFMALQGPFDEFIRANQPDCIVSDAMFTWSADTAAALGVPRIAFYGQGIFVHCVHESIAKSSPHLKVPDSDTTFVIEGLPHHIELTRREVSKQVDNPGLLKMLREAEFKSYGVIVNSFYELEAEYAELYWRSRPERRAYYVGPVQLSNKEESESGVRGQKLKGEVVESTVKWLDSMERRSVMYVSFGSLNEFSADQLREIAVGMEESGRPFVWAVKGSGKPDWLPAGFEERVKGMGIVILGWAPQMVILNHPAVGGFLTHCGWMSILESLCAGVPMVTWPVEHDQFVCEKLVVQVLKIGVNVARGREAVKAKAIAKAVGDVMGDGVEAEARRARVSKYAASAKEAMEEGGSSYGDITRLIDELQCARDILAGNGVPGKAT